MVYNGIYLNTKYYILYLIKDNYVKTFNSYRNVYLMGLDAFSKSPSKLDRIMIDDYGRTSGFINVNHAIISVLFDFKQ